MRHTAFFTPQFYITDTQKCAYLEGRTECKIFTGLGHEHGKMLNDTLSKQGFRRSQNVMYRPSCKNCSACLSSRISVAEFNLRKSHKRILRKNKSLSRQGTTAWATEEQFKLFKKYLKERHIDGGMAEMDFFEYSAMIEETPVQTRILEYYQTHGNTGKSLVAACLSDILDDGISMIYSFFKPELSKNSPGTYMILDHIQLAKDLSLPYVYLGYWVPGSPKMDYKSHFPGLEVFIGNQWQKLKEIAPIKKETLDKSLGTVVDQVEKLKF